MGYGSPPGLASGRRILRINIYCEGYCASRRVERLRMPGPYGLSLSKGCVRASEKTAFTWRTHALADLTQANMNLLTRIIRTELSAGTFSQSNGVRASISYLYSLLNKRRKVELKFFQTYKISAWTIAR